MKSGIQTFQFSCWDICGVLPDSGSIYFWCALYGEAKDSSVFTINIDLTEQNEANFHITYFNNPNITYQRAEIPKVGVDSFGKVPGKHQHSCAQLCRDNSIPKSFPFFTRRCLGRLLLSDFLADSVDALIEDYQRRNPTKRGDKFWESLR